MIHVRGFETIEKLSESTQSIVYRAKRLADKRPVVLKMLNSEFPTPQEIARFKREYEILRRIDADGVIRVLDYIDFQKRIIIVLEDFGGVSLAQCFKDKLPEMGAFLRLAVKIVNALAQVHLLNIMHKDINPFNILWNPTDGQVKIIDFGISAVLSHETPAVLNPNVLEGTPAYMSPEQTGRMNRALDYRTDFYSLGATFYRLITGGAPFKSRDLMEQVHAHIAKLPRPPHKLNRDAPKAISRIVLKLMSKMAEDRYQSVFGIRADLERCLKSLEETGEIEDFEVGRQDIPDRFQIPQKLYGRKKELQALMDAFKRVSEGPSELLFTVGPSGVGKSALVYEIKKQVARKCGYFIAGKFERYKRNVPYSSLIQAFRDLINQILTESEAQIKVWRERLHKALGVNGRIISEVIPQITKVIGEQEQVADLPPAESQNRFNFVFRNFVRSLADKDHPLVIFLDDLQWADVSSLNLLETLAGNDDLPYVLLIGSYRDDKVGPDHPLSMRLNELHRNFQHIRTVSIRPLKRIHINQLIADTLKCTLREARPLTALCYLKTNGNPFFLSQFLQSLYTEKLIQFDRHQGVWTWDINKIEEMDITDNVVKLMVGNIKRLSHNAQRVLMLAACIGAHFRLGTLATIYKQSLTKTAFDVWELLQSGLILPTDPTYKLVLDYKEPKLSFRFLHDRVHRAAYSLIPDDEMMRIQLDIGRLLLQRYEVEDSVEAHVFDIVNHMDFAVPIISSASERLHLARLNLVAGQKAKETTAYDPALRYFRSGMALLPPDCWAAHYELTRNLCLERAECEYLNHHYSEAETYFELALSHARSPFEEARVYSIRTVFYNYLNRYKDAVAAASNCLTRLGVVMPQGLRNLKAAQKREQHELQQHLANRKVSELLKLPQMEDQENQAIVEELVALYPVAVNMDLNLADWLSMKIVNLSIQFGNTADSSFGYVAYGQMLAGRGHYMQALEFGQLGIKLNDKYDNARLKSKVYFIYGLHICPWRKHLKPSLGYIDKAYHAGMNAGDVAWTGYALFIGNFLRYWKGEPLGAVLDMCHDGLPFFVRRKDAQMKIAVTDLMGAIEILSGDNTSQSQAVWDVDQSPKHVERLKRKNYFFALSCFFITRIQLLVLLDHFKQALQIVEEAKKVIKPGFAWIIDVELVFYEALILGALQRNEQVDDNYSKRLKGCRNKLKSWAVNAPGNFLHKHLLISAEIARIEGKRLAAMDLYDQAILSAEASGFTQDIALCYELSAHFYMAQSKRKIAGVYLEEAVYAYRHWGAEAKVDLLEHTFPYLVGRRRILSSELEERTTSRSDTTNSLSRSLDINTVMKAAQTISSEIVLAELLRKLMNIMIQNVGAQTGILLLQSHGEWLIEARCGADESETEVLQGKAIIGPNGDPELSEAIVNYVIRTGEQVVIRDAQVEGRFNHDPYIFRGKPKSILSVPFFAQGKLQGILYLENNLVQGAFTPERLSVLNLISAQIATSIENARLYANMEEKVKERTTELTQALKNLQTTQKQLVEVEKMAALGELVAGVAHEINTPVGIGITAASHLDGKATEVLETYKRGKLTEDELMRFLSNAKEICSVTLNNLIHAGELIQSFKQLAVDQSSEGKRVFKVKDYVKEVLLSLYPKLKTTKHRTEVICDEALTLNTYPGVISQIITNFVINSINHAYENDEAGLLRFEFQQMGNQVVFQYSDDGKGMPNEILLKVFDPFFTTKRGRGGSGLGLHIVYNLVTQRLQGKVKVQSTVGEGTQFTITMPIIYAEGDEDPRC